METAQSPDPEEAHGQAPPAPLRLKQGDTVGSRFVIDERTREDVIGTIYRAVDEKSGKKITILMMDPALATERLATERLRAAVKTATGLAHKNVVAVFGMGKEGARRYVAQEYVDGQTLSDLLDKKAAAGKQFTLKGAYNLIAHVCNALQYTLPQAGHGTLRPSVILINRTGRVKVGDFGLAELRPAMVERRAELSRWDQPCFPALESLEGRPEPDDIAALGLLLYALLVGLPAPSSAPALPPAIATRLPRALSELLARCVDLGHPQRIREPAALKGELLQIVEAAQGAEGEDEAVAAPMGSIESVEVGGKAPVRQVAGFVIPELKSAGEVDDDGTKQRWLVERNGMDYGPFTSREVIEQLYDEKITAQTLAYDIETDCRLSLSEFSVFEQAMLDSVKVKEERERRKREEGALASARRRNRLLLIVVLALLVVAGGGAGGWFWYQSRLPTPVKAYLNSMVVTLTASLPVVTLPEELPETPAEVEERARKVKAAAVRQARAVDARRMAEEERLAASSSLDAASGTGEHFDRGAFDAAVAGRNGRMMQCLQDEARRNPNAKDIEVRITVIPAGSLINVHMPAGTSAGSACVRAALSGLKVPAFDGTNVQVRLPFSVR